MQPVYYLRCVVCGKLSRFSNFNREHRIPEIYSHIVKGKGRKKGFLNIWEKKELTNEEREKLILFFKDLLEKKLMRIELFLQFVKVRINEIPKRVCVKIGGEIRWKTNPKLSLLMQPKQKVILKNVRVNCY